MKEMDKRCPKCGCSIKEILDSDSCWCGVKVKAINQEQDELDIQEFEEAFKKAGGNNLNETPDVVVSIYLWSKWSWLASRRLLREKEGKNA